MSDVEGAGKGECLLNNKSRGIRFRRAAPVLMACGVAFLLTIGSAAAAAAPPGTGQKHLIAHGPSDSTPPRIALTFDDGPDARYTPEILDILAKYHARATFFVVGQCAAANRTLLCRMVTEGHELGNHTWTHASLPTVSASRIRLELARTNQVIEDAVGRKVRWFRPPYGALDARARKIAWAAGCDIALWSVDPRDWSRPGSSVIFTRVVGRVRNGAVILMHDGGGVRKETVDAVRRIVPALEERGYELVTLSELIYGRPWTASPPVLYIRLRNSGPQTPADGIQFPLRAGERITLNGATIDLPSAQDVHSGVAVLPPAGVLNGLGVRRRSLPAGDGLALACSTPLRVAVLDERSATRTDGRPATAPVYKSAMAGSEWNRTWREVVGVINRRELEDILRGERIEGF